MKNSNPCKSGSTRFYKVEINGNIYNSQKEASISLGVTTNNILRWVKEGKAIRI